MEEPDIEGCMLDQICHPVPTHHLGDLLFVIGGDVAFK